MDHTRVRGKERGGEGQCGANDIDEVRMMEGLGLGDKEGQCGANGINEVRMMEGLMERGERDSQSGW